MEVYTGNAKSAGLISDVEGKTYYFCSTQCKLEFDKKHAGEQTAASTEEAQHGVSGAENADVPDTVRRTLFAAWMSRWKMQSRQV